MVDISAIAGMMSALKGATDITKAMIDLRDGAAVQAKVIELQSKILEAQGSAFAAQEERAELVQSIRSLEQEVARLKEWDASKHEYRLTEIGTGAFAYTPQPNRDVSEPNHWLCVKCYDNRQRSILQYQGRTPDKNESIYVCGTCRNTILVYWGQHPGAGQVRASEGVPKSTKPPEEPCPICGEPLKTVAVDPDPVFGRMGVQQHTLRCAQGHSQKRQVDPAGRTNSGKAKR